MLSASLGEFPPLQLNYLPLSLAPILNFQYFLPSTAISQLSNLHRYISSILVLSSSTLHYFVTLPFRLLSDPLNLCPLSYSALIYCPDHFFFFFFCMSLGRPCFSNFYSVWNKNGSKKNRREEKGKTVKRAGKGGRGEGCKTG